MSRLRLGVASAVLTLLMFPMLLIGQQSRCPAMIQFQLQHKGQQMHYQQKQRQQELMMQHTAQAEKLRQTHTQRMTPPGAIVHRSPAPGPWMPAPTSIQFQPPRASIPKVTVSIQVARTTTTKNITQVIRNTVAVPKGPVVAPVKNVVGVQRGAVVAPVKNVVGVTTNITRVQKTVVGVSTNVVGITKNLVMPTKNMVAPMKGPVVAPTTNVIAPVILRVPPTKLVVGDPVQQAREQAALKVKVKVTELNELKSKLGDTGFPLAKVTFRCVACHHHKKQEPQNPIAGNQPIGMPTGLQGPKPLPAPIGKDVCPPPGKPNLPQPIAGVRPILPQPIAGVRPNVPLEQPIARGPMVPLRNPIWVPMAPLQMPILRPGPTMPAPVRGSVTLQMPIGKPGVEYPVKKEPPVSSSKKQPVVKEAEPNWKTPALPPLPTSPSSSELVLFNAIDAAPSRGRRETSADEPTQETAPSLAAAGLPKIDLDGPTLPKLPAHALILNDSPPTSRDTTDGRLAQEHVRPAPVRNELDLSRPTLRPHGSRVLLPF